MTMSDTQTNQEKHMSKPNTISVEPTEKQIIVADRGWVFVGDTTHSDEGVRITDAKCIRVWGTDESKPGLGWLALNGPTSKTKLDPSGTVFVPKHALVAAFNTDGAKWA